MEHIQFHPIRCTSEKLKTLEGNIHDGEIYFLTDTKQIFLVKNKKLINMCGGVGIVYGNRDIVHDNDGHQIPPEQEFSVFEDLDNISPLANDLILNKDGCFYKVINVDGDHVDSMRVTLQGSGNGSGSGLIDEAIYGITVSQANNFYSLKAEAMDFSFETTNYREEENYINYIAFSFNNPIDKDDADIFYELDNVNYELDKKITLDLIDYKSLFNTSVSKTVYLNVQDKKYGLLRHAKFKVKMIDLSLDSLCDKILVSEDETVDICHYVCNVDGATSGISNKKITFKFFTEDNKMDPRYTEDLMIDTFYTGTVDHNIDISKLDHGIYDLEVLLTAKIDGKTQTIPSQLLKHKVIKREQENSPLFAFILPERFEQYASNEIHYYLATSDTKQFLLNISLGDNNKAKNLRLFPNALGSYSLYLEEKGKHNLHFTIPELGLTRSNLIDIMDYTGQIPIINPNKSTLDLYLTPQGYSNDLVEREFWYDYSGTYKAQLSDINYSGVSGWVTDNQNISCLQLNSGAKLNLNNYEPFKTDPTIPSKGMLKGSGITIELDFEVSGITDYSQSSIKCFCTNPEFKNPVKKGVGFELIGNVMKFYSNERNDFEKQRALVSITITEGKRTRLSFVIDPRTKASSSDEEYIKNFPMCNTYINGILSNAVIYGEDTFKQISEKSKALLEIDSTHASVKIYGIRIYKEALNSKNIIDNYIASLPTLEEREEKFNDNNVYNDKSQIDFNIVSSELYNLKIPYMVLTGGYSTEKDNKWQLKDSKEIGKPGLPTGKKDYRLVDVKVVYPDTPYFHEYGEYKNYEFINQFKDGGWMTNNFGKEPINGGCIMYAQGTSSMEYPVKNLRLRFNTVKRIVNGEEEKSKENYFTVRPDIEPVEIICMKADYMESSGSHNTGAANLIDDLYEIADLKTPGQDHFGPKEGNEDASTIVTCIKGHPCLIFYSPSGEQGTYEYVGKYNLNLDKATPHPFGFNHDDNFGWLPQGFKYWSVDYADKGVPFIGQMSPDKGGDYKDNRDDEKELTVLENQKVNSIHCFEFLDNAIAVCNFLNKKPSDDDIDTNPPVKDVVWEYLPVLDMTAIKYKPNVFYVYNGDNTYTLSTSEVFNNNQKYYERVYSFHDTWYRLFTKTVEGKPKQLPGWACGFESRYPEDRIGYHDADALWPLASWLNELYRIKTYGRVIHEGPNQDDIDFANSRFTNEYQRYLDKNFLVFYYVVTEALLMADNRVKNMMIATWGPETREFEKADKTKEIVENQYIWYPIFYDMDTMLGLNNLGEDRFKYYEEDTDPQVYNGDEILWNFVRDNLQFDIAAMYGTLEELLNTRTESDGSWSPSSLIPYFNNNQATMANEAFYNGDAVYKYIDPARKGYYDGLNGKDIAAGDAPYLYAAQGDRSLTRENFIINRLKFLQGKYTSGLFQGSDQVEFRWNYPQAGYRYVLVTFGESKQYEPDTYYYFDEGENKYVIDSSLTQVPDRKYFEFIYDNDLARSAEYVPPSTEFEFTALQPCFAGVMLGKNGNVIKARFNSNETLPINVGEGSSANGTEAYLLGLGSLKNLGDLSNKYVQKFVMTGNNKLSTLILGNPHKFYYNPYWSSDTSEQNIGLSGFTYLEEFNLQNCSSFSSSLDFRTCPLINKILLTGSSVSSISLPINGNLKELRLPSTITSLSINSHKGLAAEGFSLGSYDYGDGMAICTYNPENKTFTGEGQYSNDFSGLLKIQIVDTPIDSYEILSQAVSLNEYYVKDFEWEITDKDDCQYIYTNDDVPKANKEYYVWDNGNKQFKKITGDELSQEWSRAREKCSLVVNGQITKIPILEQLLTKQAVYNNENLSNINGYPGANGLIGTIKISVNAKVNEFNLYQKYQSYFPNVKFEFNVGVDDDGKSNLSPAYTIEFYNIKYAEGLLPYYTVLSDGTKNLKFLTSSGGPTGMALPSPEKAETNTHRYTFLNKWKDISTGEFITSAEFASTTPTKDMKLEAVYEEQDRKYTIHFHKHDGEFIDKVDSYDYEQIIADNEKTILYYHREHDDEKEIDSHMRWGFKGWIGESDFNNQVSNPTIIDLKTTKVLSDHVHLYAYYGKEEDCRVVASNLEFFEFSQNRVTVNGKEVADNKRVVSVKEDYKDQLQGAITIPAKDSEDNPVEVIGFICPSNRNITKVYIQNNSEIYSIGGVVSQGISGGLYGQFNLIYVYLPENCTTLKYIGDSAFFYDSALQKIENLPNTIEAIGQNAFESDEKLVLKKLPTNIKEIGDQAFLDCENLEIATFGYTKGETLEDTENRLEHIGLEAFKNVANPNISTITLNDSIISLGSGCFANYSTHPSLSVIDYTRIINAENDSDYFGRDVYLSNVDKGE